MPISQGYDRAAIMAWLSRDEPGYVPPVDRGSVKYLGVGEHGGPLVSFTSTERVSEVLDTHEIEDALAENCDWWADDGIVGKPQVRKDDGVLSSWDDGYHLVERKAYRAELARLTEEEEFGPDA